jgi:signal transduction histidine kinase
LFDTFLDVLGSEAFYRVERNKHHSRLRHTIGVEVHHLNINYSEIFSQKPKILDAFEGDVNSLNIQLAKVNGLIHDLSRDVVKQFGTEFDIFGNRRSKRDEQLERVTLSPDKLDGLIRNVIRGAADKRSTAHFLIELGHKSSVEVTSDSTLAICFTELFNNAVKYNIAGDRIRVRTRDRGDVVVMTISNIGPSLSKQEAELMPLMGLRGMNSQRHIDDGSGQGLATVFSILEDIGIDADYRQRGLTKEQISRLSYDLGSKRVAGLDLSTHTIELALPTGK